MRLLAMFVSNHNLSCFCSRSVALVQSVSSFTFVSSPIFERRILLFIQLGTEWTSYLEYSFRSLHFRWYDLAIPGDQPNHHVSSDCQINFVLSFYEKVWTVLKTAGTSYKTWTWVLTPQGWPSWMLWTEPLSSPHPNISQMPTCTGTGLPINSVSSKPQGSAHITPRET